MLRCALFPTGRSPWMGWKSARYLRAELGSGCVDAPLRPRSRPAAAHGWAGNRRGIFAPGADWARCSAAPSQPAAARGWVGGRRASFTPTANRTRLVGAAVRFRTSRGPRLVDGRRACFAPSSNPAASMLGRALPVPTAARGSLGGRRVSVMPSANRARCAGARLRPVPNPAAARGRVGRRASFVSGADRARRVDAPLRPHPTRSSPWWPGIGERPSRRARIPLRRCSAARSPRQPRADGRSASCPGGLASRFAVPLPRRTA